MFFFFKQKTAYEMRISDWSSDVCSSDLQKQLDEFPGTPFEALSRAIAFHADARGSQLSMETAAKAIERHAMGQLLETLEATDAKFFGLIENPEGVRALVRELHGQDRDRKSTRLNSSH